ncbi:MAG: hypothetical protein GY845_30510, partial [Planctomycetes bacterium]|nr:hypothetical protein [Planctomycetota bacterium]
VREHAGDVEPTYWPPAVIEQKRKDMGKYIFATQISLKPLSEDDQKFELNWIKYYEAPSKGLNIYILVDPAGDGKKGKSSYTVMHAVGVDWNHNKTLLDTVRDKLDLYGRWCCLRDLYLKHSREGNVLGVGYEKYSMQADIQYIQEKQLEENVIFSITQLGGNMNKNDRIRKLIPDFEQGKWFLPYEYWYTDSEGKKRDLIKEFLEEEYIHFPNVSYKDMLDALARIYDSDLCVVYPSVRAEEKKAPQEGDWMRLIKRSG